MKYDLRLINTNSGAGYFSAVPSDGLSLNEFFDYIQTRPYDEFMHRHLLKIIGTFNEKRLSSLIEQSRKDSPVLSALFYEACLMYDKFAELQREFDLSQVEKLAQHTPLVSIKSSLSSDQSIHSQWTHLFRVNIENHHPLPEPADSGLPAMYSDNEISSFQNESIHIQTIYKTLANKSSQKPQNRPSLVETIQRAQNALNSINVFAGIEMRHVSSLSPCGLLQQWNLDLKVNNGNHNYTLSGIQTSYGKGLSLNIAKASCLMEVVERVSSFASFTPEGVRGYSKNYPLIHASYEKLKEEGTRALDPNSLSLETEYRNEPIYWMEGKVFTGDTLQSIWVPVQSIFLFCNLDEINLFSGLGSTGLASGNTTAEAKVSALLESIERDLEGVTPFDPHQCFTLKAKDPEISVMLEDYLAGDIHVQFQDLTSSMGVPCYKCFVIGPQGQIIKGTAAHLDGKKAILSALTETTYPYPFGPPSKAPLPELPSVYIEDLPNYGTENPEINLEILETLLTANKYFPVYIDLTRKDLNIPVVKAIVPGMEWMADFDGYSRVSKRLYYNYTKLFQQSIM